MAGRKVCRVEGGIYRGGLECWIRRPTEHLVGKELRRSASVRMSSRDGLSQVRSTWLGMSTERLTFLLEPADLACVEQCYPQALTDTLLVFDVELHIVLLDRSIRHLTPWDIVGRRELGNLQDFNAQILGFWETMAHARYDGIDCLQMTRYRHTCCFTRLAWVAYVIRRCLETLQPREVVTFEERSGHGLDQPPGSRAEHQDARQIGGQIEQAERAGGRQRLAGLFEDGND